MIKKASGFLILIFALILQFTLSAQEDEKQQETSKIVGREKILSFTNYTYEILTLRDKDSDPAYKQLRVTFKSLDNLPPKIVWKLNTAQAEELTAYLNKFEELRNSESSNTSANIYTRIGRIENTDLFFQLTPHTAAYFKVVDRTSPEIHARISYVDLQALRRLLAEFAGN